MFYFKLYDKDSRKVYKSNRDTLFLIESSEYCKRVFRYDFISNKIEEIPYAILLWGTRVGDRILYDHDVFKMGEVTFEVQYIKDNNGFYLLDVETGVVVSLTNALFKTLLLAGVKYEYNTMLNPPEENYD